MDEPVASAKLSIADHALLLAAGAWSGDSGSEIWDSFRPDRGSALRQAWAGGMHSTPLTALREAHAAQTRPDLSRVHPSWFGRALQGEPESVRLATIAALPEAYASSFAGAQNPPAAGRPAHPPALCAVEALWSERLVGDLESRDDDPPVVVLLAGFDVPKTTRMLQNVGLLKASVAPAGLTSLGLSDEDSERALRLLNHLKTSDPRLEELAARDVTTALAVSSGTSAVLRLGLTTVARLLPTADPYRARWALQHVPYTTARTVRSLASPPGRRFPVLTMLETSLVRAAWSYALQRGSISMPWRWGESS